MKIVHVLMAATAFSVTNVSTLSLAQEPAKTDVKAQDPAKAATGGRFHSAPTLRTEYSSNPPWGCKGFSGGIFYPNIGLQTE